MEVDGGTHAPRASACRALELGQQVIAAEQRTSAAPDRRRRRVGAGAARTRRQRHAQSGEDLLARRALAGSRRKQRGAQVGQIAAPPG
jgi:hypothetical protein